MVKIAINIVLSFLILTSGIGVSLYQHYCTQSNMMLSSIALPVSCDHDQIPLDDCENGCTHDAANIPTLTNAKCCVDFASTIKIDLNILKAAKLNLSHWIGSSFIARPVVLLWQESEITATSFNTSNLLPPRFGKGILFSYCTFLL